MTEPRPARGGAVSYAGFVEWAYQPRMNGEPDPGEVVWTWVSFEEDPRSGKDRPVAIVGRTDDARLVALLLSSKPRSNDPRWLALGTGPWDPERRPSWIRVDRLLAVDASAVRREGGVIPPQLFSAIVAQARAIAPPVAKRWRPFARLRAGLVRLRPGTRR